MRLLPVLVPPILPSIQKSTIESLYERFDPLVARIARRIGRRCPPLIDRDDLMQAGRIALWQACQEADPEREATFGNYAGLRIGCAMLDLLRGREGREAKREKAAVRLDEQHSGEEAFRCVMTNLSYSEPADPFVARAVQRLGGRRAAVIALRFHAGLSRAEAGQTLGISEVAVGRTERGAIKA